MLFIENRDYRDYRDFKENLFIKGKESSNLLKGEATRKSFKKCSVYCLFLKSLNKCRCFLLKCRVQSVHIAYCSQPPKPRYCSVVPNIGEHCSSVPGLVLPQCPSGQCVLVRCYGVSVWGGGARPLTPGCSGSSSSPAQQCAVYSSSAQHAAPSSRGGYIPLQHCTAARPTPRATRGLIKQRWTHTHVTRSCT